MNRCTRCCYPDTRPDAHFVDGVCSGCRSFESRKFIDYAERLEALKALVAEAKTRNAPYDCIVPVSGGKDSTWQVLKMLELGAHVLAVNAGTDYLSDIGRRNLDNLKRFCDVIEYTPNIEVRKKLVRIGLYQIGDMSFPEHLAIWGIPTRIAVQMGIPLVVWGEQPQREYSAPAGCEPATRLDGKWVAEFGGHQGLRVSDLIGMEDLTESDLAVFRFPPDAALEAANVQGIWLGDFVDWDGWKNAFVVQQYGFEVLPFPVEQSAANYENIDNFVTCARDWLRFLKFGYARATDIVCNHIRRGRLTRDEGLKIIKERERFPWTSLGKPLHEVLAYFDLSIKDYFGQCERWKNHEIFDPDNDPMPRPIGIGFHSFDYEKQ